MTAQTVQDLACDDVFAGCDPVAAAASYVAPRALVPTDTRRVGLDLELHRRRSRPGRLPQPAAARRHPHPGHHLIEVTPDGVAVHPLETTVPASLETR